MASTSWRIAAAHPVIASIRCANSLRAHREILADVVEDLRAVVPRAARPCRRRRAPPRRRFEYPCDSLPAHFADQLPPSAQWITREYPRVRARLLAADEELRRAIDGGISDARFGSALGTRRRAVPRAGPPDACRLPLPLQILPHPLAAALSPEADSRDSRRSPTAASKRFVRVHPHHARLDLRRDVEREVDVLRPHARARGRTACCSPARRIPPACGRSS